MFLFRFVCFFPFNSSENILFYIFNRFYETRNLSIIWRRPKATTPILLFYFLSMILMGWNLTLDTRGTLIKKKKSSKTRLDWKQTVHKLITRRTSLFMCTLLYIEIIGIKNWPPLTIELRTEKEWIRNVDILPEYLNSPSVVIGFMLLSLSLLCSILSIIVCLFIFWSLFFRLVLLRFTASWYLQAILFRISWPKPNYVLIPNWGVPELNYMT